MSLTCTNKNKMCKMLYHFSWSKVLGVDTNTHDAAHLLLANLLDTLSFPAKQI